MITYSCDCCGNKIDNEIHELKIMKHIIEPFNCHIKMIDGVIHNISGVDKKFDLCLICYNTIMNKTYENFIELKNTKINSFKNNIPLPPKPPEDRVFRDGEPIPKPKRLKK